MNVPPDPQGPGTSTNIRRAFHLLLHILQHRGGKGLFDCQVNNGVVNFMCFCVHILQLQCDLFLIKELAKHNMAMKSRQLPALGAS